MEEVGYCADPARVRVFPGASEALRRLQDSGYLNVIVSNQSGIGRGYFAEADYRAVQEELLRQLGAGLIAASYFCPDAPEAPSERRKPAPGMLLEAAREWAIDLGRAFIVGDKASDIECGRRAGTRTVLVSTGYGAAQDCAPDYRAASLPDAVDWILARDSRPAR